MSTKIINDAVLQEKIVKAMVPANSPRGGGKNNDLFASSYVPDSVSSVLIIDGSYLQIGIRELNTTYDTNFRIEREGPLKKFL
jgi:hypothetical protein